MDMQRRIGLRLHEGGGVSTKEGVPLQGGLRVYKNGGVTKACCRNASQAVCMKGGIQLSVKADIYALDACQ